MKRFFLIIPLALHSVFAPMLFSENQDQTNQDTLEQIADIEKSIQMLKKWQSQYLKKKSYYESERKRVLFRNKSPKDAQKADRLAREAYANVEEIQVQINSLEERKNSLKESKL